MSFFGFSEQPWLLLRKALQQEHPTTPLETTHNRHFLKSQPASSAGGDQESNHVVCFSLVCKYVCINNVCHVCGGLPLSPSRSFSQVLSLSLLVAPTAISELLYTAFATWDPVAQKERFRVGKWAGAITTPFGSFSARILGQWRGSARSQGWWMLGGATAAGRLLCFGEKLESYPPKRMEVVSDVLFVNVQKKMIFC